MGGKRKEQPPFSKKGKAKKSKRQPVVIEEDSDSEYEGVDEFEQEPNAQDRIPGRKPKQTMAEKLASLSQAVEEDEKSVALARMIFVRISPVSIICFLCRCLRRWGFVFLAE